MFPRFPGIYPTAAMAIHNGPIPDYMHRRLSMAAAACSADGYDIHAGNTMNGTETGKHVHNSNYHTATHHPHPSASYVIPPVDRRLYVSLPSWLRS
jgi:hypothetical protein